MEQFSISFLENQQFHVFVHDIRANSIGKSSIGIHGSWSQSETNIGCRPWKKPLSSYIGESPAGLFGDPGPRYRDELVDRMAKARGWSIRPVSRPLRLRSWSVGLSRLSGSRRVWSSLLSLSLRRPRREGVGWFIITGKERERLVC